MNDMDKIREELQTLVGHKITGVAFDQSGEGMYCLALDDGRTVLFTSSGDDMTWTSMSIK